MSIEIQMTEHPYVVRHPGIGNGEPIIKETRIAVRLIAGYYKRRAAVAEIERDYAFLSTAAIYDAISYYLDEDITAAPHLAATLRRRGFDVVSTIDAGNLVAITPGAPSAPAPTTPDNQASTP